MIHACVFCIQVEQFNTGDVIRVIDDIARVHDLQENHGGWVDDMALVSGSNSATLYFVVDSLSLPFLFLLVSGSGWSCGEGLPHWRCPSGSQWQDVDIQPSLS